METPEVKEIANEPFDEKLGAKSFPFRNIGMGRAIAVISSWLLTRKRDEIRDNSMAFSVAADRAAYVREELGKLPKGKVLADAAIEALCGDDDFIKSKGKKGQAPTADEVLLKNLIKRGYRGDKPKELEEAMESMELTKLARVALRIMGIKTEKDMLIEEAGGTPPKKAS